MVANIIVPVAVEAAMLHDRDMHLTLDDGDDFRDGAHLNGLIPNLYLFLQQ